MIHKIQTTQLNNTNLFQINIDQLKLIEKKYVAQVKEKLN
jgi:hypothetical protein